MPNVGEAKVKISADTTEFEKELGKAQRKAQSFGEAFGKLFYGTGRYRLRQVRLWSIDVFWIMLSLGGMAAVLLTLAALWQLYSLVADVTIVVTVPQNR